MKKAGFTLVEIMIVVCIIGMLAAIAVPSYRKSRMLARASVMINDLRLIGDGINMYSLDHKHYPWMWPPPPAPAPAWQWDSPNLPAPLDGYVDKKAWENTPYGGQYQYWGGPCAPSCEGSVWLRNLSSLEMLEHASDMQ